MAAVTQHGCEGYTRMPYGSFTGKTQQAGYTAAADSPDAIGRAPWQRPYILWLTLWIGLHFV